MFPVDHCLMRSIKIQLNELDELFSKLQLDDSSEARLCKKAKESVLAQVNRLPPTMRRAHYLGNCGNLVRACGNDHTSEDLVRQLLRNQTKSVRGRALSTSSKKKSTTADQATTSSAAQPQNTDTYTPGTDEPNKVQRIRIRELTAEAIRNMSIEKIVPTKYGGLDHPYNYFLVPQDAVACFRSWDTPEKMAYIGRKQMRTALYFHAWCKNRDKSFMDFMNIYKDS